MGSTPAVTVAIATCCNRARFLREAIQAVLDQTLKDIEVYVSNDGSTDDTPSVVASFEDPRVQYVPLPPPGGLHANLNHCLRLGTAPFIAICQDDDYWLPHNLATLVEIMERHSGVGLAHGAFRMVDTHSQVLQERTAWGGLTTDRVDSGEAFIRRSMAGVNPVNMSSALIRREVLGDESFRVEDDVLCDLGMWLRLALRGGVAFAGQPLTSLRVHSESISVTSGINEPDFRRTTFHEVRLAQRAKERFLAEFASRLQDREELRGLSRGWARRELLRIVIRKTFPERPPGPTLRSLREAVQIERSVLRSPRAWRIALSSMVGARGRRLARRVVGPARPIDAR